MAEMSIYTQYDDYDAISGMSRAEAMTQRKKRVIIQKTKICNYGTARYLYANTLARQPEYTLSRTFINSVKYELPTRYYRRAYMRFINKWGTVSSMLPFQCRINFNAFYL